MSYAATVAAPYTASVGTPTILFDDGKGHTAPLTDLRPAYGVRTGAFTIAERLIRSLDLDVVAAFVPAALVELAAEQTACPVNQIPELVGPEPVLIVSGRLVVPIEQIGALEPGQALICDSTEDLIAAKLVPADALGFLTGGNPPLELIRITDPPLLARPWGPISMLSDALDADLALLAAELPAIDASLRREGGVTVLGEHPVLVHPSTELSPTVVIDARVGAVAIDENAIIEPQALIAGPAYVGPGSTVLAKAHLKARSCIGPVCKVAGEIGSTVFQGYANKGHDGHLGDSWIGEWANLGAATTNSNLLNTYTDVVAAAPGQTRERTGLTFLGCVLGDHTKTAIATRIMTGAIAGTGTMHAAGTPLTGTTDRFAWVTDGGRKHYRIGKFVEVAMTVMDRRGIRPSQAYSRRLTILHEAATGEHSAVNWPGKLAVEQRAGGQP